MKSQILVFLEFGAIFFATVNLWAVTPDEEKSLLQELTGVKDVVQKKSTTQSLPSPMSSVQRSTDKMELSRQHLLAGSFAASEKKYGLALRHYQTVIQKYSTSKDVAAAYLAKSELYKEMGLIEQSKWNLNKYQATSKVK